MPSLTKVGTVGSSCPLRPRLAHWGLHALSNQFQRIGVFMTSSIEVGTLGSSCPLRSRSAHWALHVLFDRGWHIRLFMPSPIEVSTLGSSCPLSECSLKTSEVLGLADTKVKELESFGPQGPMRVFVTYLGLHLHFLRVLNISPQGTSNRYSPHIMVGADVYWCTAHMSTFYNQSMYMSVAIVPYHELT